MSLGVYLQYATDSALSNFVVFTDSSHPITAYKIAPKIYSLFTIIVPGNVTIAPYLYRVLISNNGAPTSAIQILNANVFGRNATVDSDISIQGNDDIGANFVYLRNGNNPNVNWLPKTWNGNSDRVCIWCTVRLELDN
jgi:hypothetical protein